MNIAIDRHAAAGNFHVVTKSKVKASKEKEKDVSPQQRMIDEFKEQNSSENTRKTEIYYKFRSGKKLTPEELEYLAKEAPDLYRQVKEIMLERQVMEAQMQRAETKEEVADVHLNEVNNIKNTMGTGKLAESQAEKTLARVNQIDAAYREYTATLEYKEKEDIISETKEQRERLDEKWQQQEEVIEEIAETEESDLEEMDSSKKESDIREDEVKEKPEKPKHRKKSKKTSLPPGNELFTASIDYDSLRQKVRDLYHPKKKSSIGIDVSL